jgi:hypothetical protein
MLEEVDEAMRKAPHGLLLVNQILNRRRSFESGRRLVRDRLTIEEVFGASRLVLIL